MKRLLVVFDILLTLPCLAFATVPDTGQTKCYDNTQEITCPNPGDDFYGQDAQYGPNLQSFTKLDENGNDLPDEATSWIMVRDNITGLIWEVKTDDGSIHDKDNTYNWDDAQSVFIASLNVAQFGGFADWRLPTIKELSTLVDSSIPYSGPTINTAYFPYTVPSYYWSSAAFAFLQTGAWLVGFVVGDVYVYGKWEHYYVRAVRGEQSNNNFKNNGDSTVTDTSTGLMWELRTDDSGPRDNDNTYTWQEALAYCESLTLAGYSDWRLPNRNELHSIVDYGSWYGTIDPIFSYAVPGIYWSSTTYASGPSAAWNGGFSIGGVIYESKGNRFYVRAVREGRCGEFGDSDGDTVCDIVDNCPNDYNPLQVDCDNDGTGDACDPDTIDSDGDGVDDACDNCLNVYNPGQGNLDGDGIGDLCDNCPSTSNPNQLDSYPPQGNDIGDACECEGNFNCSVDQDVDGSDASTFKADFGRSILNRRCITGDPCNGDFSCDGDVDGTDASLFKQDFGRNALQNPCPVCVVGPWCQYQ